MNLAQKISGESPLPEPINTNFLKQIEFQDGNARLQAMLSSSEELKNKHIEWKRKAELVDKRMPMWELLVQLIDHGSGEEIESITKEVNAIKQDRLLLSDPDPVEPLLQKTTDILKHKLTNVKKTYNRIYDKRMSDLQNNESFKQLTQENKHKILLNNQILKPPEIKDYDAVGLRNSLSKTSIDTWKTKISALDSQFDNAIAEAVKLWEPKAETFSLPRKTLSTPEEIEAYTQDLKKQLNDLLKSAKSIILK